VSPLKFNIILVVMEGTFFVLFVGHNLVGKVDCGCASKRVIVFIFLGAWVFQDGVRLVFS